MAKNEPTIALKADPNDPDDFDVAEDAVEQALAERRARLRGSQKAPTKEQVTLRLDRDVLAHFKAGGAGWQTRLNKALEAYEVVGPDVLKSGWAVVRRFTTPGANHTKLHAFFSSEAEAEECISSLRKP